MTSPTKASLLAPIKPWSSLWETGAESAPEPVRKPSRTADQVVEEDTLSSQPSKMAQPSAEDGLGLSQPARHLAYDTLTYPYDQSTPRRQRLDLSGREFGRAKGELEEKGLIRVISIGRALYLVPTPEMYAAFQSDPPHQKRDLSLEHGFAIRLAAHLIRHQPLVSQVATEVPIGASGAAVDIVAHMRDGSRNAYEVTLSLGNVVANAAKCQDKGFATILFLCRHTGIKEGAHARLREAGLPPELYGRCRAVLFSTLTARKKSMTGE